MIQPKGSKQRRKISFKAAALILEIIHFKVDLDFLLLNLKLDYLFRHLKTILQISPFPLKVTMQIRHMQSGRKMYPN